MISVVALVSKEHFGCVILVSNPLQMGLELTINCAIPRHSCSSSGAGLLSELISVPQLISAKAMNVGYEILRSACKPTH